MPSSSPAQVYDRRPADIRSAPVIEVSTTTRVCEWRWRSSLMLGNIYTTEVDTGKRAQKFRYVGPAVR
jgi:hypothetical protein